MKRFAANYLYIPEFGFLKQYVVEITNDGKLHHIFPLTEEIASVAWLPGVLILLSPSTSKTEAVGRAESLVKNVVNKTVCMQSQAESFPDILDKQVNIVNAFPFDFEQFRPCTATVYRLVE